MHPPLLSSFFSLLSSLLVVGSIVIHCVDHHQSIAANHPRLSATKLSPSATGKPPHSPLSSSLFLLLILLLLLLCSSAHRRRPPPPLAALTSSLCSSSYCRRVKPSRWPPIPLPLSPSVTTGCRYHRYSDNPSRIPTTVRESMPSQRPNLASQANPSSLSYCHCYPPSSVAIHRCRSLSSRRESSQDEPTITPAKLN